VPGAAGAEPAAEAGWLLLSGGPGRVSFRLPTVAEQLAVLGRPDAADELKRRCVRPADLADEQRARVEAAMEALAPALSGELRGTCPECGSDVKVEFDARWYCLCELRNWAAFIHEEVDLLARRYHWSERDILALPHARRAAYAELARRAEEG
jgi:hypothetical protein